MFCFIVIREVIKVIVPIVFGYEALEFIAYGFGYDEITTYGTSNCVGCVEFDKFKDAS